MWWTLSKVRIVTDTKQRVINKLTGVNDLYDNIIEDCNITDDNSYEDIIETLDGYYDNDYLLDTWHEIIDNNPDKDKDWCYDQAIIKVGKQQRTCAKEVCKRLGIKHDK